MFFFFFFFLQLLFQCGMFFFNFTLVISHCIFPLEDNRVSSGFGCQFYRIIGHFYTKI